MSDATMKVQCRQCGGMTNHNVLYDHSTHWWLGEPDNGYQCEDHHQVVQCNGCGTICFRHLSETPAQELPEEMVYPPIRRPSRWPGLSAISLPDKVRAMYQETVTAFESEAHILCAAGLRAVVEALCLDKKVKGKNLNEKIDELVRQRLLAEPQAELLHENRFLGNAALHELEPPDLEDLEAGLRIIETLVETLYLLPDHARRLKEKRTGELTGIRALLNGPARPSRKTSDDPEAENR